MKTPLMQRLDEDFAALFSPEAVRMSLAAPRPTGPGESSLPAPAPRLYRNNEDLECIRHPMWSGDCVDQPGSETEVYP